MQKYVEALRGYKTYVALWLPVVAGLLFLQSPKAAYYVSAYVPEELAMEASWLVWIALAVRALDQTFMRLGIAKAEAAKKLLPLLLACALCLPLAACSPGMIRASEIKDSYLAIRERHDDYVNADSNATKLEKTIWLRSSAMIEHLILKALGEPTVAPTTLQEED